MKKERLNVFLALFALLFIFACAGRTSVEKEDFFEEWKVLAKKSEGHSPPNDTIALNAEDVQELVASDSILLKSDATKQKKEPSKILQEKETPETPLPKNPVTINIRTTTVITALRALARAADQNMVIDNDVGGTISLHLKAIPWDEAFKIILQSNNLTFVRKGSILRVLTLSRLEQELKRKSGIKTQEKEVKKLEALLPPRVIPIKYANAKKIHTNLSLLLAGDTKEAGNRGQVIVDDHTNSLILIVTKSDLLDIIPLINELDRPTNQILIEANIVETSKDTARSLGIQWGGKVASTGSERTSTMQVGTLGNDSSFGVDFPAIPVKGANPGQIGLTLGQGDLTLQAQLSALESEGKLNVLSSPSITTIDNQTAFTENGTRVPYVTLTNIEGTLTRTVKFVDAVLRLEITPHVIDGRLLKLKIVVKKDEVDQSRGVDGNPFIIKKQTVTNLIVENRETIVISGFTKESHSISEKGYPWLRRIPLLGWFFKNEDKALTHEEVLIFITPRILPELTSKEAVSPVN